MVARVAAWPAPQLLPADRRAALRQIGEDLLEQRTRLVGSRGGAVQLYLPRVDQPAVTDDSEPVQVETDAELDAAFDANRARLVLPPPNGLAEAPHREVVVGRIDVGDVLEQGDHRLTHQHFAISTQLVANRHRRVALQPQQEIEHVTRPAGEPPRR